MSRQSQALRIGIIAPAPVPVVVGGAERLWASLAKGIEAAGHRAEIVTLPFPETTLAEVVAGYRAFRSLDVSRFDVVISGKYPAWMIEHPCHIVYMLHPLRGLYDTYPSNLDSAEHSSATRLTGDLADFTEIDELLDAAVAELDRLGADPIAAHPSPLGRAIVHRLDELALGRPSIRALAAISNEVASRPDYFPTDRAVQVVHPVSDLPVTPSVGRSATRRVAGHAGPAVTPSGGRSGHGGPVTPSGGRSGHGGPVTPSGGRSGHGGPADYEGPVFFTASRHDAPKRIDLIIRAFRRLTDGHNDRQLSLLIAGDGPQREALEREASGNERIEFLGRVTDQELADHYGNANVTVFLPLQEDFGYISLESMLASTPVLTTTDAGGANELLDPGVGGLIVEPTVAALAEAMDHLADNPYERWRLGINGHRRAATITWTPLLATIEDVARTRTDSATRRPSALMVSTFGIEPAVGGGQRRVRHLARALARSADVTVLALVSGGEAITRRVIEPGITLVEVPRSAAHLDAEAEITRIAGFPVDDITCGELWPSSPDFVDELDSLLTGTTHVPGVDVVITSHPFLAPAVAARLDHLGLSTRFIYDSHNAESPFKASMLADSAASPDAAAWLVKAVTDAETTAATRAHHISACTADDLASVIALAPAALSEVSTAVVANGVDTTAMPRRTETERAATKPEALALTGADADDERPLAVFIGSWHPPNIDAAKLIIELAAARSDIVFALAGSHTLQFDQATVGDNVHLLPAFAEESLWPLLAGSDIALNPMVSGGGSNLKLYDYLAVGVPVITTRTGARGLDDPDSAIWEADPTVESLSAAITALISDPAAAMRRANAGRAVAEEADWRLLGHRWAADVMPEPAESAPKTRDWPEVTRPIVATTPPPPTNPTIELMARLAAAALDPAPPVEISNMNPNLREQLKRMTANRHAGRQLPHDARLKLPKKALIRAGQAITNEQLVFNEATVDVVTQLSEQVAQLQQRIDELENEPE